MSDTNIKVFLSELNVSAAAAHTEARNLAAHATCIKEYPDDVGIQTSSAVQAYAAAADDAASAAAALAKAADAVGKAASSIDKAAEAGSQWSTIIQGLNPETDLDFRVIFAKPRALIRPRAR